MKKLLSSKSSGFTLIELLIVIVIIVIVVTIGAVSYTTVARNSRNAQRITDLNKVASALELYYADHGLYPNTNGKIESAGRSGDDLLRCIVGGQVAIAVFSNPLDASNAAGNPFTPTGSFWDCRETVPAANKNNPDAFNVYFGDGVVTNLPIDPLFSDFNNPDAHYAYASDPRGQSFVLVTRRYEGTPPEVNRFTAANDPYFFSRSQTDSPWPADFAGGNQYVVRSPKSPPPGP